MWLALFLASLAWPTVVFAHTNGDYHGPGMMWGGGWGGMGFGLIVMIVVIVAVIAPVVLLVRWLSGAGRDGQSTYVAPRGKTPLDILKERYARGEIDKDEFEERRRTLES